MATLIRRAERLPDGARLFGGWGVDRELAAQTVELLQVVTLALARLGGVKRLPRFAPVPRPARPDAKTGRKRRPSDGIRDLARMLKGGA